MKADWPKYEIGKICLSGSDSRASAATVSMPATSSVKGEESS